MQNRRIHRYIIYYYQFYSGGDPNKSVYLNMFYNKYPNHGDQNYLMKTLYIEDRIDTLGGTIEFL